MKYLELISCSPSPILLNMDSEKKEKLAGYMEKLLIWNEKINLTAIKDPEEFIEKHYFDSLSIAAFPEYEESRSVADIGTGGGFPGIPLAIFSPEKEFVLIDSLAKRLKVIEDIAKGLGIENIKTVHGRAEDLGRDLEYREKFDLAVSRAVSEMPVLVEYTLPFVKTGGKMAAYKSLGIDGELAAADTAIKKLGGKALRSEITGDNRQIILIEKTKKTPPEYPRKAGTPKSNPIK